MTRDEIINKIKAIAKKEKLESISKSYFKQKTGVSEYLIYKLFDSWDEAIEIAGLESLAAKKIRDESLFKEMLNIFNSEGILSRIKFSKKCKYSVDTYKRRFGKWENILLAFKEWLIKNNIYFEHLGLLPNGPSNIIDKTIIKNNNESEIYRSWNKSNKLTTYGELISFRGLQHAPVNEQGVVFLFGMIAFELGFLVESVQTGFPDCEAKRKINKNQWQKVRIEFEYKSNQFKDHGHNINGCDIIVCWINNWPDCPIEVIELQKEIQYLET